MPQLVNVVGRGVVSFPDGMTQDQITDVLRTNPPPSSSPEPASGAPKESTGQSVLGWISGVHGPDASATLFNELKTVGDSLQKSLVPTPRFSEKTAEEVGRAGIFAVGSAVSPMLGNLLANTTAGSVARGVGKEFQQNVDFLTSPAGISLMGTGMEGVPLLVKRSVAAGFAAVMAKQVPELSRQAGDAAGRGDTEEASRLILQAAQSIFGAAAGGAGAVAPKPVSGATEAKPPPLPVLAEQIKPVAPLTAAAVAETPREQPLAIAGEIGKDVQAELKADLQAELGPDVAAGVKPAIQTPEGRVVTGEDHVAAYEKAKATGTPDTSGSKEGFVDDAGQFISREEAAVKTGLPTGTEPGKLHSSDLPKSRGDRLKLLGLNERDISDLESGKMSVSQVVERKLPGQPGRGPDHAQALMEARIQAVSQIEDILKTEPPASAGKELKPTQAQAAAEPKTKPTGSELESAVIPGAKQFVEQDLIPFAKESGAAIGELAKGIKAMAAPPSMGGPAKLAAGIIREQAAALAQKDVQAREKFNAARKSMDRLTPKSSLDFIDRVETGSAQPTPALQGLASALRGEFDKRVAEVKGLGTGKLEHVIQDYFPHLWQQPDEAVSWYSRILGKRPLRGPASFLKQRKIPTTREGVDAGLVPLSWNPVNLSLLKFHEIDRYVMGQKIFTELKEKGLAKFDRSDIAPEGYAKIDDRIANVVEYRPTVKADGTPGAPERVLRGHWYVQTDAARVVNNFLSPGLERFKWYRAIRWAGNTLNMAQLGFSGYHFNFTMIDSGTSKLSLGLEMASQGKAKGISTAARGSVPGINQLEYYLRGSKVLQEYTKPGSVGGEYAKVVDGLLAAGGRTEMPGYYKNNTFENFMSAIRSGNYPGAILRAPFAAIEGVSKPLMQNIVPRLKLGVFSDMALAEIDRMGPSVSRDEFRARMGKIWDSVDNRMGELVYDNLFWNRTMKDLSFLAVRAVGWNLGTIREIGGGFVDSALVAKRLKNGEPALTRRMAYVVALPITVGMMGAIYQYAKTGKGPDSLKDYFYPKTGQKLPDGTEERVQFPSYLKDIASYSMHPFRTLSNKLHPLWSEMAQMFENKDYYGGMIRNPDDPLVKQVGQELKFVGANFIPLSVRGAGKRVAAEGEVKPKVESFFGIMPIPAELARTKAQNKIIEYIGASSSKGGKTVEQQNRYEMSKEIEQMIKSPADLDKAKETLSDQRKAGKYSKGQAAYLKSKLGFESRQMEEGRTKSEAQWIWRFKHLSLDQAQHVYDLATPSEKKVFEPELKRKISRSGLPVSEPSQP